MGASLAPERGDEAVPAPKRTRIGHVSPNESHLTVEELFGNVATLKKGFACCLLVSIKPDHPKTKCLKLLRDTRNSGQHKLEPVKA